MEEKNESKTRFASESTRVNGRFARHSSGANGLYNCAPRSFATVFRTPTLSELPRYYADKKPQPNESAAVTFCVFQVLTLGELEAATGAFATVFLAFFNARVARQGADFA